MLQKIPVSEIPACFTDPISYPVTVLPLLPFHRPESITDSGVTSCHLLEMPFKFVPVKAIRMRRHNWLVALSPGWGAQSNLFWREPTMWKSSRSSEFTFTQPHWFGLKYWSNPNCFLSNDLMDGPVSPWVWGELQLSNQGLITDLLWLFELKAFVSRVLPGWFQPLMSLQTSQWYRFKADNGNKVTGCEKTSSCFNSGSLEVLQVPNHNRLKGLWNEGATTVQK